MIWDMDLGARDDDRRGAQEVTASLCDRITNACSALLENPEQRYVDDLSYHALADSIPPCTDARCKNYSRGARTRICHSRNVIRLDVQRYDWQSNNEASKEHSFARSTPHGIAVCSKLYFQSLPR